MVPIRSGARLRLRASSLAVAGALIACLSGPAAASAWLVDGQGAQVPNTDSSSTTAQLAAPPSVEQKLAEPGSPQDDDPDALAQLGPTGAPDDDLGAALDRLAGASDGAAAAAARDEALAILTGDPLPGRPYSGIPLLNWNAPAKVRRVPAGGEVTVTQVRFGNHVLSDTALLSFEDPARPFTVVYRIAELGGGAGAELAPTPLLDDGGTPIGGQPSVLVPLGLPSFPTDTSEVSRFHPGGAGEQTRLAVQRVEVRMPPAGMVTAILDTDDRPGHEALAILRPATAERLASIEQRFGFAGDAPSAARRAAAIRALGSGAPERQLHDALAALDAGDVAAARRAGADLRPLVGVMRTRTALPPGFAPDPAADVTVVLVNDEAYVSRPAVHLPAGRSLHVEVINGDGFARDPEALRLAGRSPVFGALDLGRFDWGPLGLGGPLAGGERRRTALDLEAGTHAVWLGDATGGDQAGTLLRVDRGPRRQSVDLTGPAEAPRPFSAPLGAARDAGGDVWTALAGADELARVRPAGDLAGATTQAVVLPGGAREPASAAPRLAPHAVAVDGRGIVWSTLRLGSAIARVDPAQARDGTADGVRTYPLAACTAAACALTGPPDPVVRTRAPAALAVTEDGEGNSVLWFAQEGAAAIGALRVAPDGTQIGRVDFPCDCRRPRGIGLDGDGRVWFTEGDDARIGRLTQDATRPWSPAAAEIVHFTIPSRGSDPRGLAVDRSGRVWFTEAASGRIGLLDPAAARPGTSAGIRELALSADEFGARPQPHGIDVDRSGTAFWTDGFGDAAGSVTADGAGGALRAGPRFGPAERQSLLGAPMLDGGGDLWFAESAAGLLTRIAGVSAGRPGPALPARVEADLAAGALRAEGLREMTSVDVRVARGGATVLTRSGVAVSGGAFALGADLRAGDVVTITPRGPVAPAAFGFRVPALAASAGAGGRVTGTATLGGAPVAGRVTLALGATTTHAAVDPVDGTFATTPVPAPAPGASGTVAWTTATPAAAVTTLARFGAGGGGSDGGGGGGSGGGDGTGGGGGGTGGTGGGGGTGAGGDGSGAGDPTTGGPGPESSPGSGFSSIGPLTDVAAACRPAWLTRRGRPVRRRFGLLGLGANAVERCLGRPLATARAGSVRRWTMPGGVVLRLRSGRVTGFTLTSPAVGWRSAPDRAGIGSDRRRLEVALGRLTRDGRALRAVLPLGAGRYADVRVTISRVRATQIAVDTLARDKLDRRGRALARKATRPAPARGDS